LTVCWVITLSASLWSLNDMMCECLEVRSLSLAYCIIVLKIKLPLIDFALGFPPIESSLSAEGYCEHTRGIPSVLDPPVPPRAYEGRRRSCATPSHPHWRSSSAHDPRQVHDSYGGVGHLLDGYGYVLVRSFFSSHYTHKLTNYYSTLPLL
jgi:hypothetical protein